MNTSVPELQERVAAMSDSPEKADRLRNNDTQQALAHYTRVRQQQMHYEIEIARLTAWVESLKRPGGVKP